MKRKAKHTDSLYRFLDQAGVLSGTDADIVAAKREYRKQYQARWRKERRHAQQELTVSFLPAELQVINGAARKHKMSRPKYVQAAAIAYMKQLYIVPDILSVHTLTQYLALAYNEVQKLFEENMLPHETGKEAMRRISEMEAEVKKALCRPEKIEDWLLSVIRSNPAVIETIRQLLNTVSP